MSRLVIAGGLCAAAVLAMPATYASSLLYVADQPGDSILPLDTVAQMYRPAIVVGAHPLRSVASLDGTRVYVQSANDGSIAVVDTTNASVVARVQVPSVPPVSASLSLSPDGGRLYVVPTGTSQVTIVDTATNSVLAAVVARQA